jgi:hypothetical protein
MRMHRSVFPWFVIIFSLVAMLLLCLGAGALADSQSVSVQITIRPSISLNESGAVKSNVSSISIEGEELLTAIVR